MAYRRKQGGLSRSSTFKEEVRHRDLDVITTATTTTSSTAPSSPLSRRTNANSPSHSQSQTARIDSFLSSGALHSSLKDRSKGSATYDYTSMKSTNEPGGFWCVLARKAKSILDDRSPSTSPTSSLKPTAFSPSNHHGIQYESYSKKNDDHIHIHSPTSRNSYNGVDTSLTSYSLNQIGDTIGNALEEAAKKSEDRIQETSAGNWKTALDDDEEKDYAETIKESTQLKATRHVAIATADKAKQLLRELKSVKADLVVAKERCCQLEEENKILREKGPDQPTPTPTDDDMIRDQLETLLAEKGVLAHENSVYARENRYLREIVEFHHLSMQDHMTMYLDLDQDDNDLLSSINQSHPVSD